MADAVCAACGHHNALGANFCSSCGAPLDERGGDHTTMTFRPDELTPAEEAAIDEAALPPDIGILLVRRGPKAGSRYVLSSAVTTVGRHPESEIFLDDITVSRRHAEILRTGTRYELRDAGSLNGTYLNRERIEAAELHDGDLVQVGKFKLMFVATGEHGE
ncbi:MAG TPA: FHA domain-containing protein [Acidimicrobiales bacterium]|nr:FHA domain-containing protein [Acidimicrobiales bacterium]